MHRLTPEAVSNFLIVFGAVAVAVAVGVLVGLWVSVLLAGLESIGLGVAMAIVSRDEVIEVGPIDRST